MKNAKTLIEFAKWRPTQNLLFGRLHFMIYTHCCALYNMKALCECLRAEHSSFFFLYLSLSRALTVFVWLVLAVALCSAVCMRFVLLVQQFVPLYAWFVFIWVFICAWSECVFVRSIVVIGRWCVWMFDIQSHSRQRIL